MQNQGRKKHYEIWVIVAAFLIYGGGQGILLNTTSVFVKPVTESLGIPRGLFSIYSTITMAVTVIFLPKFGRLFSTRQLKKIMVISAVVCSLIPFGYAMSRKLWHFYVLAVVQGAFINGAGTAVVAVLINNWFVRKKGIATGIAYAGSGVTASVMISLANSIIAGRGWQAGYVLIGIASFLVLVPTTLWLPVRPQDIGCLPYGSEEMPESVPAEREKGMNAARKDIPFEKAVRSTAFYLLMISGVLTALPSMAFTGSTVAYLSDLGYSVAVQSSVTSLLMLSMSAAKVIIGAVLDRFGSLAGVCVVCISTVIATVSMSFVHVGGIFFAFVMAVFMGMGATAGHVVASFLTNEYWGGRDFSRIYSYITISGMLGSSLAIPLPGLIYDHFGSYLPAWYMLVGVAVLLFMTELGALFRAGKERQTYQDTDC